MSQFESCVNAYMSAKKENDIDAMRTFLDLLDDIIADNKKRNKVEVITPEEVTDKLNKRLAAKCLDHYSKYLL